jgi:hypothetical protein
MTDPHCNGGRVVPVYAVTGGRTRAGDHDLPVESVVTAVDGVDVHAVGDLQPEYRAICSHARTPVSLVEVAAHLGMPIGVARVLVSDLAEAGHLVVHAPDPANADGPPPQILVRLLEGLRAR